MTFDKIKKAWWWFDETCSTKFTDNAVAWQWELLRRSRAYHKFCAASTAKHDFKLVASNNPLGDFDPLCKWRGLFQRRCDPDLCWTDLTEAQRDALKFYAPLYLHADVAASFGTGLTIDSVFVKRLNTGAEELLPARPNCEGGQTFGIFFLPNNRCTAIETKHPSVKILPKNKNEQAYIVIGFDVRAGEFAKKQLANVSYKFCLDKTIKDLKEFLNHSRRPAPKSLARVVPSYEDNRAQAWIPADNITNQEDILARFTSLIGSPKRRDWLRKCKKAWHSKFKEFPAALKTKPARAYIDSEFKTGFCAFDCREIETRFTKNGLLIPFLKQFPVFNPCADSDLLRTARKRVSRLITRIDHSYAFHSLP